MSSERESGVSRTPDEFERAVAKLGLLRFNIHDCSICGYPCGFVFNHGRIGYDSGCDCGSYDPGIRVREWQDLADHYNRQTNEQYITEMDNFFGFAP